MGVKEGSVRLPIGFYGVGEDIDKKQLEEVEAWWGKITVSVLDIINICCETFTWRCQGDIWKCGFGSQDGGLVGLYS